MTWMTATLRRSRGIFEGLWPVGLVAPLLLAGRRTIGAGGEPSEWALYLAMGLLFLACLPVLGIALRHHPRLRLASGLLRLALGVGGVSACVAFGLEQATAPVLALAALNALLLAAASVRGRAGGIDAGRLRAVGAPGLAVGLVVLAVSWLVASRLVWWTDPIAWVRGSVRAATAMGVAMVLVSANLARIGASPVARWRGLRPAGTVAGLVVLLLASLRLDSLGAGGPGHPLRDLGLFAFHHWGAIVGPAELVRQGGWLLWDTPSQYGFLSALAVAWMPAENAWRSLYLVNAGLTFVSASVLFLCLRMLRSGVLNLPFALLVTMAAVFMIPGWPFPTSPIGPQATPAVGAYRFVWGPVLVAVLVAEWRARPGGGVGRILPIVGCVAWLIGTLWSCESAAYCAVIWGPAYLVMSWRRAAMRHPDADAGPSSRGARLRSFAAWAMMPAVLLAGAVGAISLYYVARLGHPPDWRAFADYVLAMKAFALPIDPGGIVLALVLAFCLVSVVAAAAGRGGDLGALALGLGAWGLLWSGCSYFVGRSHEVNGSNISALVVTAVAAGLLVLRRGGPAVARVAPVVTMAASPLLIALLTATFGVDGHAEAQLSALRRGYRQRVERLLPAADAELIALLDEAGVAPGEPVTIAWEGLGVMPARRSIGAGGVLVHETWAPPFVLCVVLPADRQQVYLRRQADRHRDGGGGWLVLQRDSVLSPLYRDLLLEGYRPTSSFENERWQLSRLEADGARR